MLVVVVSDTKSYRKDCIEKIVTTEYETIVLDDTLSTITDLEQYMYPSLFSVAPQAVHMRFMLENNTTDMTALYVKKLIASPTVFIFEELLLPTPLLTTFKKYGAVVLAQSAEKKISKGVDMFALASSIVTPNKKDAWMNFQNAITQQPIEGLLGILYWKVREVMLKNPHTKQHYKTLYTKLLQAQARAWQTNTPLALMVEKVLLE